MKRWIEDLYVIYQKLEASEWREVKKEIVRAQLNGCSGGEIYFLVLQQLLKIKKEKASAYALIQPEAESIIRYGANQIYLN
jgi:hypothetical protein